MKKIILAFFIFLAAFAGAQQTANRFFYELTYKPRKDDAKLDRVMSVLDITKEKSLFRDYTMIAQDSLLKAKIETIQKTGVYQDISKEMKMPKFSYKIEKKYPEMQIKFIEGMLNGMSPMQLAYTESPKFDWKVFNEKSKVGDYKVQKATTKFGGRNWTAWFDADIPFQDGPYKFSGLPGLIVKIEDDAKNYSWELKGNKKIENFTEETQMEKMRPGGTGKTVEVTREKFEKTFNDYKKDPFASFRSQMTPEVMARKIPGQDKTVGDMIKEQEKRVKDFYGANDNPIETSQNQPNKKNK